MMLLLHVWVSLYFLSFSGHMDSCIFTRLQVHCYWQPCWKNQLNRSGKWKEGECFGHKRKIHHEYSLCESSILHCFRFQDTSQSSINAMWTFFWAGLVLWWEHFCFPPIPQNYQLQKIMSSWFLGCFFESLETQGNAQIQGIRLHHIVWNLRMSSHTWHRLTANFDIEQLTKVCWHHWKEDTLKSKTFVQLADTEGLKDWLCLGGWGRGRVTVVAYWLNIYLIQVSLSQVESIVL